MLTDIKIPAGFARNGTKYQNRGRWVNGNHVRFAQGTVRPRGGWAVLEDASGNDQTVSGKARAGLSYTGANGLPQAVIGTHTKLYGWSERVLTDITPADLVAGDADSSYTGGSYGSGTYGTGPFGTGGGTGFSPADVWHLDNFGEYLVACLPSDGRILLWDRNATHDAAEIDPDAPTSCWGVVVTPERFVVALGANGDRRSLVWCDIEDYTVWDYAAPAPGSQSGSFTITGEGALMAGRRATKETLIWTTRDLYAMRYIDSTLVYGFTQVGANCGLIGPQACAVVGTKAFWMGANSFYMYDGYTRPLPCEVQDAIFSDVEATQGIKVQCIVFEDWNEVMWLYPSAGSNECDSYAVYNWEEQHWTTGSFDRVAGCSKGGFGYPIMADSAGNLYEHERGHLYGGSDSPYIESAPIQLSDGDRVVDVTAFMPDEKALGDVSLYVYTAYNPTETEVLRGPYSLTNPTSVRWTARQIRVKLVQNVATDWRYGVLRADVQQGSRR